jgi:hypothetical protein
MTVFHKRIFVVILCFAAVLGTASSAPVLFDYGLNLSGDIFTFGGSPFPANVDSSGFDFNTGLGTITVDVAPAAAGNYFVDVFFDHDLSSRFGNEQGSVSGSAAAGQTWQIGPPGAGVFSGDGQVIDAFSSDSFDDTNHSTSNPPFDVSMGMGFHFSLSATQSAVVVFHVTTAAPTGFYLRQFDADNPANQIFFSASETAGGAQSPVPEPAPAVLTLAGMCAMFLLCAHRRSHATHG